MFVVGNFLIALARVVDMFLLFFYWIILLRALISWVNPDPFNPFVQFLNRASEPVLRPIRRFMPPGRIDFSPIIAFVLIIFLQSFLVASIRDLGYRMNQTPARVIQVPVKSGDFQALSDEPMVR